MTRRSNRFRLLRFRSPLLSQSRFLSFPPGTEMVHFPGFARTRLWIHRAVRGFCPRGFPHSEISGSMPACGSPKLIAACHVFHRLLLPRHPPCALSSLTIKLTRPTAISLDHPTHCHPERTFVSQAKQMRVEGPVLASTLSSRAEHRSRDAKSRETLCLLLSFRKTTTRRENFMSLNSLLIARSTLSRLAPQQVFSLSRHS